MEQPIYLHTDAIVNDLRRLSLTMSRCPRLTPKRYANWYFCPGLRSTNEQELGDLPKYTLQLEPIGGSSIRTSKYAAADASGGITFACTDVVDVALTFKSTGATSCTCVEHSLFLEE